MGDYTILRSAPLRRGVVELAKTLAEANTVFIAPTGYGKSKSVPLLLKEAEKLSIAARVIHVLPLRALVRQQYLFLREHLGNEAGYLAGMRLDAEGYSPFMLRKAVVSTLDSFALNLARLPVAELPLVLGSYEMNRFEGHYELPRAAIFTSLVVLDEAHLYAEPWSTKEEPLSRWFLATVLPILADTRTPLVIETATMSTRLIGDIARTARARVLAVCQNCGPCSNGWRCIRDPEFEEENSFRWRTERHLLFLDPARAVKEATRKAIEVAETGRRVLYSVNTVKSALSVYSVLREKLGDQVVLIHGRLSQHDREKAIEGIERARVIVATQVVEAGVDVDAEVLVAEAAAPSSLAQRVGRLCRSEKTRDKCRSEPPMVAIYRPETTSPYGSIIDSVMELVQSLVEAGGVEWRLLDDANGYKSFRHLVEKLENTGLHTTPSREALLYKRLLGDAVASVLGDASRASLLVKSFCSLVRGTTLTTLAVPLERGYDFIEVPLSWLSKENRWSKLLDCNDGMCRVASIAYTRDGSATAVEEMVNRDRIERMLSSCQNYVMGYYRLVEELSRINKGVRLYSLAFVLRSDAYVPGLGLIG